MVGVSSTARVGRTSSSFAQGAIAAVHATQALFFFAALATGLLLFAPALRATLVSGYSESIRGLHRWSGRGQVLLALAIAGLWIRIGLAASVSRKEGDGLRRAWRVFHVSFVAAAAIGFAATGIVMSSPSSYSLVVIDYSLAIHLWLTYMSCAVVVVHACRVLFYAHRRQLIRTYGDPRGSGRGPAQNSLKEVNTDGAIESCGRFNGAALR